MHAESTTVDDLFGPDQRLRAPLFQRRYVWSEDAHLAPFWADLRGRATLRLGPGPAAFPHFLGAILLQRDGADPGLRRIIDGQQRLLTLYMTLAALRTAAQARELDELAAGAWAAAASVALTPAAAQ